jgi:hypothetical protein
LCLSSTTCKHRANTTAGTVDTGCTARLKRSFKVNQLRPVHIQRYEIDSGSNPGGPSVLRRPRWR